MVTGIRSLRLPVIDISNPSLHVADQLVAAAMQYGFVYIKSMGLDLCLEDVHRIFQIVGTPSYDFFNLPDEEKAKFAIGRDNRGWLARHAEKLDPEHQERGDFKEAMNIAPFVDGQPQQDMPDLLTGHHNEMDDFLSRCHLLCLKLLRLFGMGLKVFSGPLKHLRENTGHTLLIAGQIEARDGGEDWLSARHSHSRMPSGTILRLLYYPALSNGEIKHPGSTEVRAGAHSDYGSITLLFQRASQPGLEIWTSDSTWQPVDVNPPGTENDPFPPILVNIADLLSYWTNGLLRSTVHRVVSSTGCTDDRYSVAYFCHPASDTKLVPIPGEMIKARVAERGNEDTDEPPKVITAEQHLNSRLAATYGFGLQDDPAQD